MAKKMKEQLEESVKNKSEEQEPYAGDYGGSFSYGSISTGDWLLDFNISGGVHKYGGLSTGICVMAYGPDSSGKTVLGAEIGGNIQRKGGDLSFFDAEGRLDFQFVKLFGLKLTKDNYTMSDTVESFFTMIRDHKPKDANTIDGVIVDSFAQFTTDAEMADNDAYNGTRQREFSKGFRKYIRHLRRNNMLMFATNQIREKFNAQPFERKYYYPGGKAIGHNCSLILRFGNPQILYKEVNTKGKKIKLPYGTKVNVFIEKNSTWGGHRNCDLFILDGYGIDTIRSALQYIKDYTSNTVYMVRDIKLDRSLDVSCQMVEAQNLENELRQYLWELWNEIENSAKIDRKPKERL